MRTDFSQAQIGIYSYKHGGAPADSQFEFDLERFRDPIGNQNLRKVAQDGTHAEVKKWIREDPRLPAILESVRLLAEDRIVHGGFKWISFAFTDFHGRWISRAVAEIVADSLSGAFNVGVLHGPTT